MRQNHILKWHTIKLVANFSSSFTIYPWHLPPSVIEYRPTCSRLSAFILRITFTASGIRLPLVALKRTET